MPGHCDGSGGPTALQTTVNQWLVEELQQGYADDRTVRQAYVSQSVTYRYDVAAFDPTPERTRLTTAIERRLHGSVRTEDEVFVLPGAPSAVIRMATRRDVFGNEIERLEHGVADLRAAPTGGDDAG